MAYNKDGLRWIGGKGNKFDEGKMFIYTSSVDGLDTILASGYFDTIAADLEGEYLGIVKGTDGQMLVNLTSSGTVVSYEGAVQSLSGAGAANLTAKTILHTSTSTDNVTLANGLYVGQIKVYILLVDGGTSTFTPATRLGYAVVTCADAGDTVTVQWTGATGWAIVGLGGVTNIPVVS